MLGVVCGLPLLNLNLLHTALYQEVNSSSCLGMGQVQNGCLYVRYVYIRYRSSSQKTKRMSAKAYGLRPFAILMLNLLYRNSLLFCWKSIFMCGKHLKIVFMNTIVQRKFFEQISKMSTLNKNYFAWNFCAEICLTRKSNYCISYANFYLGRQNQTWKF